MPNYKIKTYACKVCGKTFESKAYNVFYCNDCRRRKRKRIAHNAYRKTHPLKYKESECILCGKTFKGTRLQKYCCEKCEEKGSLLPVQTKRADAYIMYLKPGKKDKMELLRRGLGFGTMSALLKASLSEYMEKHIDDREELDKAKKMLDE